MKIFLCIAAVTAFVSTCTNTPKSYVAITEQAIEYQISDNEFAVVIVQSEGVTEAQAKRIAKQRAAELAFEKGYRYIVIESEQETQVIKSDRPWPDNQAFYGNMYQELIIEGDFNRDRLARRSVPDENLYPAYRIVFKAYEEKKGWNAIDVCTLTQCN